MVTPEGKAADIKVIRSLSQMWDQKAVEKVSQWTFTPATKDSTPTAVRVSRKDFLRARLVDDRNWVVFAKPSTI